MTQTRGLNRFATRFAGIASLCFAACVVNAQSQPPMEMPQVHLDAAGLAPRSIEDLTGTTVARHYALAWRDLGEALDSNQAGGLGDEFVGFAKDHLTQKISEQRQADVHTRIVDHGHHLKAVFYATDGTAMQLFDEADLEIQTFDGNKLIDTQSAPHRYMVLMTPGADRWYVRGLEEISANAAAPCHGQQAEKCR